MSDVPGVSTTPPQQRGHDLETVYRQHREPLLRLAYLVGGSRELAEDAVQAAFAGAHARWDRIDQPVPYLRRAVVNSVRDAQRRRFRARAQPPERIPVVLPPEVDETWQQLARLPATQRAVVVLHYYEDLPLAEVADLLGRKAATVRSDHRRALAALRKALS